MKYIFAICMFIFSVASKADEISQRFIGVWTAWSTAGMAIYNSFRIDENYISWAGHRDINPECKVRYKLIDHMVAKTHPDVPAFFYDPDNYKDTVYDYFMIELEPNECSEFSHMLLTFPRTEAFHTDGIYNTFFIGYGKNGSKESITVNVSRPK